jgi:hypothetical protein
VNAMLLNELLKQRRQVPFCQQLLQPIADAGANRKSLDNYPKKLDICIGFGLTSVDYVIRRFNASSAGLKKRVGAGPTLGRRLTRSPFRWSFGSAT